MPSVLEKLLAKTGHSTDFKSNSKIGQIFRQQGVADSKELCRIVDLPRRVWTEDSIFAADVTDFFKLPLGTMKLRPIQAIALSEMHDYGGLFGSIKVGAGKCVSGETEIFDARFGRRCVNETVCASVLTVTDKGVGIFSSAVCVPSGQKPCLELTLADGASVVLSEDHPVLSGRGWVPAGQLCATDFVAVPSSIPEPPVPAAVSNDEVVLMAYLLSDGSVNNTQTCFTNATPAVCDEFIQVADRLSDHTRNKGKRWKLSGVRELLSRSNAREFSVRGVSWFRQQYGINGLAKEKRLPAFTWILPTKQIALFLNRFWACDGYVDKFGFGVILASERMIDDLKVLLLRLGVHARKHYKATKLNGRVFPAWRLYVSGAEALRFLEAVNPVLGKEKACSALLSHMSATSRNTNTDVVPVGLREFVAICDEMKIPGRGDYWDVKGEVVHPDRGKRGAFRKAMMVSSGQYVGREKFAKACEEFGYTGKLAWLGSADLHWEKIRSIRTRGVLPVFDLSVPETGCFVGGGIVLHNTLLTALAPTLLDSKRPLLLIPAKLREKTKRDFAELRKHWQMVDEIRIESYEMVSRAPKPLYCEARNCKCTQFVGDTKCVCQHDLGDHAAPSILDMYAPDLIISDEASHLANPRAAVTRRTARYMRQHPTTRFVALSGTITKHSLHNYHHIISWCLPKIMPLPRHWPDLVEWAFCLDERVDPMQQFAPGALFKLMNGEEIEQSKLGFDDAISAARKAYRRRLTETAGVVATSERYLGSSLSIEVVEPKYASKKVEEAFRDLRENNVTPDGHPVADPSATWRHAREFGCGFFYRWEPAAPKEWLIARSAWAKFVREVISHNRTGIDSELQVAQRFPHEDVAKAWKAIRDTFTPNSVPVWFDDSVLKYAQKWMTDHPGIVWVEHRAFGHKLSEMSGVPYYSDGGCDELLRPIEEADTSKPIIASIASNAEGRNLQAWHENLIVSLPPTGTICEQLMGRTHRDGQKADEVSVEILVGCIESWDGLMQAKNDARYLYETLGQEQKLLHADWIIPDDDEVRARKGPRWHKPEYARNNE